MGAKPPFPPPGTDGPDGTGQTGVGPWGGEPPPKYMLLQKYSYISLLGVED